VATTPTLVGVGNPIVGGGRAASSRPADLTRLDLLAPLPSTGEEARGLARLFGRDASILEGTHATRAALEQSGIGRAGIVHSATHGLIDEEHPERSGLVLTADPPRDDGLLQVRQIYGLRLDAALVTLSAGDTALGRNLTGEGMIGLTRAFFYAGARSVVASLWDVEDTATAYLMQLFYARLRAGEPIDQALQQAKLTLLRAGGTQSRPFYWAAFVVSGEARAALPPAIPSWRSRAVEWTAAVAAVLVALLFLAASARRARVVIVTA
jgi:CHAT domain-containing protein